MYNLVGDQIAASGLTWICLPSRVAVTAARGQRPQGPLQESAEEEPDRTQRASQVRSSAPRLHNASSQALPRGPIHTDGLD